MLKIHVTGDEAIGRMEHVHGEFFGDRISSEVRKLELFVRSPLFKQL